MCPAKLRPRPSFLPPRTPALLPRTPALLRPRTPALLPPCIGLGRGSTTNSTSNGSDANTSDREDGEVESVGAGAGAGEFGVAGDNNSMGASNTISNLPPGNDTSSQVGPHTNGEDHGSSSQQGADEDHGSSGQQGAGKEHGSTSHQGAGEAHGSSGQQGPGKDHDSHGQQGGSDNSQGNLNYGQQSIGACAWAYVQHGGEWEEDEVHFTLLDACTALGITACAWAYMQHGGISEWLSATAIDFISRISTSNLLLKFLSVLAAGVPFVLLSALCYSRITGTPFSLALLKFYAIVYQLPDASIMEEKNTVVAFIFSNAVFYIGLFSFAILLGIVSDEIKTISSNVRNGRFPVTQVDHTVILNWNDEVPSVLRQLALGRKHSVDPFYKKPVAVLANMPKADMDRAIATKLNGLKLEVSTRSGYPGVVKDLQMVGTENASSVIIMQPDNKASGLFLNEAHMATSTMALDATLPEDTHQNVVLQSPVMNGQFGSAVQSFNRLEGKLQRHIYSRMSNNDFVYRLNAMSAVQPGLLRVYRQLMCPTEHTLQSRPLPDSRVGKTFQECRRLLLNDITCGFVRGDTPNLGPSKFEGIACDFVRGDTPILGPSEVQGIACGFVRGDTPILGPSESEVMQKGDRLIFINTEELEGSGTTTSVSSAVKTEQARMMMSAAKALEWRARDKTTIHEKIAAPVRIIVIHNDVESIGGFLADYLPQNSEVVFISTHACPVPDLGERNSSRLIITPQPASTKALMDAGIATADSVVIGGVHDMDPYDADALVSAYLMQVQDAVIHSKSEVALFVLVMVQDAVIHSKREKAPYVLAPKNNFNALSTVKAYFKSLKRTAEARGFDKAKIISNMDLVNREDILSGVLVQSAAEPAFGRIINELIGAWGHELFLREPSLFSISCGDPIIFADVFEACRAYNETAIAIVYASGHVQMAPRSNQPMNLQKGDMIAVIGDGLNFKGSLGNGNLPVLKHCPEKVDTSIDGQHGGSGAISKLGWFRSYFSSEPGNPV
eukprot:gene25758-11423_t